jgi:hypothetical protein
MLKIDDKRGTKEPISIKVDDIDLGTVFYGSFGYKEFSGPYLRMFNGFVSLSNPADTWITVKKINEYTPVKATLVIEKDQ